MLRCDGFDGWLDGARSRLCVRRAAGKRFRSKVEVARHFCLEPPTSATASMTPHKPLPTAQTPITAPSTGGGSMGEASRAGARGAGHAGAGGACQHRPSSSSSSSSRNSKKAKQPRMGAPPGALQAVS